MSVYAKLPSHHFCMRKLILTIDYEPPVRNPDANSSRSSTSQDIDSFQEYARQYLPVMVERTFEITIQERFQSLEAELTSCLNVKATIRNSLSELFRSWQERTSSAKPGGEDLSLKISSDSVQEAVPAPATTRETGDEIPQTFSDLPDPELQVPHPPSDSTVDSIECIQSASDSLNFEYPCICDNEWLMGLSSFRFPDQNVASDQSQRIASSQESSVMIDNSDSAMASTQGYAKIPTSMDDHGKGKARQDDSTDPPPHRIFCCFCGGL